MTRRAVVVGALCILAASVVPGLSFLRMRAAIPSLSLRRGPVHPVLFLPHALLRGKVREVLAHAGDRVEQGAVLVRFDAKDLETRLLGLRRAAAAVEGVLRSGESLARIPPQARQYLTELHPDTQRAEQEYVDALAASQRVPAIGHTAAKARLERAAEERIRVRRELGRMFSAAIPRAAWRPALQEINSTAGELEKLLKDTQVTAPEGATVDVLEVRAGDEVLPGQPVAVLVSANEYSMELKITAGESSRLHAGMLLSGRLDSGGARVEARVESLSMVKLPVIARDRLQVSEEPVLCVRIHSAKPLPPGSMATLELP